MRLEGKLTYQNLQAADTVGCTTTVEVTVTTGGVITVVITVVTGSLLQVDGNSVCVVVGHMLASA